MPDLSDQLRQAIRSSGQSCYRIAREAGTSDETLSRFMTGKRGLRLDVMNRIAALLKLKLTADEGCVYTAHPRTRSQKRGSARKSTPSQKA